jgi:hypothetical protein
MVELIGEWARRTSSSFFGDSIDFLRPESVDSRVPAEDRIYRLRHWPVLPGGMRTADVLKLLSLMSSRPVRRSWVLRHTRLDATRLDRLLQRLEAQHALETIDPSALPLQRQAN